MPALKRLASQVGLRRACAGLGLSRATYYRGHAPRPLRVVAPRPSPACRLTIKEQESVLAVLHGKRFIDQAPAAIYATLLDEGQYLCSVRTMYRLLAQAGEIRDWRRQRRRPVYRKPELLATGPNEVWSWDITKLRGPIKWNFFQLYVVLDIFSRYVVGWMVAHQESAALAEQLLAETCDNQQIVPGQLTIHADRGTSMTSKPVAFLLDDLGVSKTHSRPHVSDDNPYSEAQFKTLKYRPEFPDRFGCLEDARRFCQDFFAWYNHQHRHSGIGLLTPAMVHEGQAAAQTAQRQAVLLAAYEAHPNRFFRQLPRPPQPPVAAWINKPLIPSSEQEVSH